MSSFNTAADTDRVIQKYGKLATFTPLDGPHRQTLTDQPIWGHRVANHNINILTFNQSKYPRVSKDTLLPVAKEADSDNSGFYPPGHGNVMDALK
jgi:hypothetical protein